MICEHCKGTGTEIDELDDNPKERPCFECEGEGSVCSHCLASDCPGLYGRVQCPDYGKRQPDDFDGERA